MKIRKQVYDLTLGDFRQFPVWEFALDEECEEGQDEATVRPYLYTPPLDPAEGMFAVLTEFTGPDAARWEGYLTPSPLGPELEPGPVHPVANTQPVVVVDGGQVPFWYGILAPTLETVELNYRALGKDKSSVFPLKFRTVVDLVGGPAFGELEGFLHMERVKRSFFGRRETVVRITV